MEMMGIWQQQPIDGVIETKAAVEDLPRIFDSEKAKSSALLELLGITHANREYHINERDLINCYAQAMNISTEKLLALELWVEKQLSLYTEVEKLLEN